MTIKQPPCQVVAWPAFPDDVYVASLDYKNTPGYWMSKYNLVEIGNWAKAAQAYHDMLASCPAIVEVPQATK